MKIVNNGQKIIWNIFYATFATLTLLYISASYFANFLPLTLFEWLCKTVGVVVVLLNLSWQLSRFIRSKAQREYISPANRAVLVTGCDTGFGHRVCQKLDAYGFSVFAGCLFPDGDGANDLREKCSKRLRVVELDVTKADHIKAVVHQIEDSGLQLWAVLNNAGISYYSLIEMGTDLEVFEKIFAVNVFGLVRVTKCCLPLLRKSRGRVVNMASIAGRFAFPGITAYCMSKFAVRSFSDGLRREMVKFGVKVVTIEPNLYRTGIMDVELLSKSMDKLWSNTDEEVRNFYGGDSFCDELKSRLRFNVIISRPHIYEVIDAQEEALTACEPELYYRCSGPGERPALWLLGNVTESAQDFMLTGRVWKKCLQFFQTKS